VPLWQIPAKGERTDIQKRFFAFLAFFTVQKQEHL
jgi:hypothetical protein